MTDKEFRYAIKGLYFSFYTRLKSLFDDLENLADIIDVNSDDFDISQALFELDDFVGFDLTRTRNNAAQNLKELFKIRHLQPHQNESERSNNKEIA